MRCSAKTALRLSAVLVDFDNPFPECACSDSCTWPDIAGKSEVRAHQMARKLRSAGFTPQKLRAELSSNLSALKLRGAGLTPQNLHAGLPSNLSMEQASGAQYTSGFLGRQYLPPGRLTGLVTCTAGSLALAVLFVPLDDLPFRVCWLDYRRRLRSMGYSSRSSFSWLPFV